VHTVYIQSDRVHTGWGGRAQPMWGTSTMHGFHDMVPRDPRPSQQQRGINAHGYTWMHTDTHGCTWIHVDAHGYTWMHSLLQYLTLNTQFHTMRTLAHYPIQTTQLVNVSERGILRDVDPESPPQTAACNVRRGLRHKWRTDSNTVITYTPFALREVTT
jgi:hypothetical protein